MLGPAASVDCSKRVLDLGSGSGRDSYVCSALVGEQGSVTGIDMTTEQLKVCLACNSNRGTARLASQAVRV